MLCEKEMGTKRHYYAITFIHGKAPGVTGFGTAYVGFPDQLVSRPRLDYARQAAGVSHDAALLGVSYMGHMTDKEFDTLV